MKKLTLILWGLIIASPAFSVGGSVRIKAPSEGKKPKKDSRTESSLESEGDSRSGSERSKRNSINEFFGAPTPE